jgi:hypothetical protein
MLLLVANIPSVPFVYVPVESCAYVNPAAADAVTAVDGVPTI